jgi:hypothetical protein
MDPRTRPDHLDGAGCVVCRRSVPADRIRLLAERDDLVFAELDCPACGSTGLAMIVFRDGRPDEREIDGAPPVDASDVLAMRSFLAEYQGDLRTLVTPRRDRTGAA